MRIGIDARPLSWSGEGGVPRVCSNLVREIVQLNGKHELYVFSNQEVPEARKPGCEVEVLSSGFIPYVLKELPAALRRHNCDVLLSCSTEIYRRTIPSVLIVYDVYPLAYREWMPRRYMLTGSYWRQIATTRFRLASIKKLSGVLAISEATALDIRSHLGTMTIPMKVALPGGPAPADSHFTRDSAREYVEQKWGLDTPFFLHVGAINYQKNVQAIVESFTLLRMREEKVIRLVLVGHFNWPRIKLSDFNSHTDVVHIPWVSESDLSALYLACVSLICVSFREGFGLPVLEAMSHGAPVIVSNCGSLPEVVGKAGILVDPSDANTIVEAMNLTLNDDSEASRQSRLSYERSAEFSWKSMAQTTLEMIEDLNLGE